MPSRSIFPTLSDSHSRSERLVTDAGDHLKADSMNCVIDDTGGWALMPCSRYSALAAITLLLLGFGREAFSQAPFPASGSAGGESLEPLAPVQRAFAEQSPTQLSSKIQQVEFDTETLLTDPIVDITIEGNTTIQPSAILRYVETRVGRNPTPREVRADVANLYKTGWFLDVKPVYRKTEAGLVLVFEVVERPMLKSIQYIGNKKIKTTELEAHTGLHSNLNGYYPQFDVTANKEAVKRIKSLYVERGYRFAEVTLQKGDKPHDREVVFLIKEGPKLKVRDINFNGNDEISRAILKTKISTKTPYDYVGIGPVDLGMGWIGGDYDPEVVQNDVFTLKQYYLSLGYFDVDVSVQESIDEETGHVALDFQVTEGQRYVVGEIEVFGQGVLNRDNLLGKLELESGEHFNARFLRKDVSAMKDKYDDIGHIFSKVEPVPHFRENEPGIVDLTYQIDEDIPRYIGMININIRGDHPHTQEHVVRNQIHRFLQPGKLASGRDLRMAQQRVQGSPIWERAEPAAFDIVPVDGLDYIPVVTSRGQDETDAEELQELSPEDVFQATHSDDFVIGQQRWWKQEQTVGRVQLPDAVYTEDADKIPAEVPVNREVRKKTPSMQVLDPDFVFRGQSEPIIRAQHLDQFGNQIPQDYINGGVSNSGDPFGAALTAPPTPGFVDVNIDVTEGRTGRLMFGAGVNSNAGVVGSLTLQEDNFDILRFPRSWSDVANGQAFRGGGQSFRLEAVPGSQVSRYLANWTDPFFMGTDFSLGLSGFFYNRFYYDWTEDRLGGRISLGYVLNRYWTANTSIRLEDVEVRSINSNLGVAPDDLLDVRGNNFLSTVSGTLEYDTRDNSFIPSAGHNVNFTYEQGFGEFNYPKFTLTGSQYFTLYERPDGFGKHIVSFSGQGAWTGDDTPIFERFYAGGYSSFRGFQFRGVTPREGNFVIGGNFMALGTAQYEFPITASDSVRGVVFSDFGTVEEDAGFDEFRATAGFGLRLVVPAMGPAPLAFDLAWPITKQPEDQTRVFSFTVGFTR